MALSKAARNLIASGAGVLALGGGALWASHHWKGITAVVTGKKPELERVEMFDPVERLLKRGNPADREVTLTIDDGPHPKSLKRILEALKAKGVHATFFVVGMRVKQHPELVKRMIDEGHEVGNHTNEHLRLDLLNEQQVRNQIEFCATNIERATGTHPTLLRPPGMRMTPAVLKIVLEYGYVTVGWNIGAKDFIPSKKFVEVDPSLYPKLGVSPEQIADRVVRQLKPGTIILLHDMDATANALPLIIDRVRAEGYEFKSTAQMLADLPEPVQIVANPPVRAKAAPRTR